MPNTEKDFFIFYFSFVGNVRSAKREALVLTTGKFQYV